MDLFLLHPHIGLNILKVFIGVDFDNIAVKSWLLYSKGALLLRRYVVGLSLAFNLLKVALSPLSSPPWVNFRFLHVQVLNGHVLDLISAGRMTWFGAAILWLTVAITFASAVLGYLFEMTIFSSPFFEGAEGLELIELCFGYSLIPEQKLNRPLEKTESLQEKASIELLRYFLLAIALFFWIFPRFTQPTLWANSIGKVEKIGKNIEGRKLYFLLILSPHIFLCQVKFIGHVGESFHEEHQAQYGPHQPSNIRKKLVNFVEGSFVGGCCTWPHEVEPGEVAVVNLEGNYLEFLRNDLALIGVCGCVGKQTLICLYLKILDIAHRVSTLFSTNPHKIGILHVVIQVVCAARVDERVDKEQTGV